MDQVIAAGRGSFNGLLNSTICPATPGDYFGELGLLTGEPLNGELTALTRAVIYEISKDALSPLLKVRPSIAEELSESLG